MRILICPDKFKGSLTASEVCDAIEAGILKKYPDAEITKLPLADGGEGTAHILTQFFKGKTIKVKVHGPLFEEVEAEYGTDNTGTLAFIEMASASGLQLLAKEKQDPLETTTLGTGELIKHAVDHGAKKIILGIGGSSTNDAGIGMASALGFKFFHENGELLKPIGKNLIHIARILAPRSLLPVIALCDVNNPLFGPNGAAHIYGPQKGATPEAVELLDEGLMNFEKIARKTFGKSPDFAGAGAGGGIAGGASIFFNLEVKSGISFLIETMGLVEKIMAADLVITGEGKIDRQTLAGKVVATVAKYSKRTIAVCGICELRKNEMEKLGISDVISLVDPFTAPEEAIKNARKLIISKLSSRDLF
ncbi:MAG TPA: glycerate kinase [Cyclobacteriaceae bacterium]